MRNCASCHTLDYNTPNVKVSRTGPALGGVWGRKVGSDTKYTYSNTLTKLNFVWTE